jgi:hypothetical protein
MTAGRILAIVSGVLAALVALGLLAGGGVLLWAYGTKRDDNGFYSTRYERFASPGYAVRSDDLDLGTDGPDWLFDQVGTIRIRGRAATSRPLFLGVGREDDVERYLNGVEHEVVTDVDLDPWQVSYRHEPGSGTPRRPGSQTFWAARGRNAVTWEVEDGSWVAVLMNADASRGVAAEISVAAKSGLVLWAGIIVLLLGVLAAALAVYLLRFGLRSRRPGPP